MTSQCKWWNVLWCNKETCVAPWGVLNWQQSFCEILFWTGLEFCLPSLWLPCLVAIPCCHSLAIPSCHSLPPPFPFLAQTFWTQLKRSTGPCSEWKDLSNFVRIKAGKKRAFLCHAVPRKIGNIAIPTIELPSVQFPWFCARQYRRAFPFSEKWTAEKYECNFWKVLSWCYWSQA